MEIPFKYYLHDSKENMWDLSTELETAHEFKMSPEAFEEFRYSFYEVTVNCLLDTETGKVTILSANN